MAHRERASDDVACPEMRNQDGGDFRAFAKTIGLNEIRNAIADGEIDAKTMCAKFAHMGS